MSQFILQIMAEEVFFIILIGLGSFLIARSIFRATIAKRGMFRAVWPMMIGLSLFGTLGSSLLVVFNKPAIVPRNPSEWAADALVIWALPYFLSWPKSSMSPEQRRFRLLASICIGIASICFLTLVAWCSARLAARSVLDWRHPDFAFVDGQTVFFGIFVPMLLCLSAGLTIRYMQDKSKSEVFAGSAIACAVILALCVVWALGMKVGQPQMVFGIVRGARYVPDNESVGPGVRDTTEVLIYTGPNMDAQSTIHLCGNQLNEVRPGNYYRGIAQTYVFNLSDFSSSKECDRISNMEEWNSSSSRPAAASGILQKIEPAQNGRALKISLLEGNGSVRTAIGCADGLVPAQLRFASGLSVEIELDAGLHSTKLNCDPVNGILLATVVGSLAPSDPQSGLVLLALARPPHDSSVPNELIALLKQEWGDKLDIKNDASVLTTGTENTGIYSVSLCDVEPEISGAWGCPIEIWIKDKEKAQRVLSSGGQAAAILGPYTNGVSDLVLASRGAATVYQFNGKEYVQSACFAANQDSRILVHAPCAPATVPSTELGVTPPIR